MKRCIIFTGGNPEPQLPDGLGVEGAFVIAADSGYRNCRQLGLTPNLAIGDFDSLEYVPNDCRQLTFPKEKDDTDLMLAVREALNCGCDDITVLGAMGGRFDHTFANVQTLGYINAAGAYGRILSQNEEITLLAAGEYTLKKRIGFSLSLFSYSESVIGLNISGVKYPLADGKIDSTFPIGISNEIMEDIAEISFSSGLLLVVQSRI